MDYTNGYMKPVENSRIPYAATVTISYDYASKTHYEIDFSKLYEGEHPDDADFVPSYAIDKVMFPIMPAGFEEGNVVYTGESEKAVFTFSDWTVSGGDLGDEAEIFLVCHYKRPPLII